MLLSNFLSKRKVTQGGVNETENSDGGKSDKKKFRDMELVAKTPDYNSH